MFFNVSNEFFEIITQMFFMFFVIRRGVGNIYPILILGLNNIIPRLVKLQLMAYYGSKTGGSVGRLSSGLV